MGALKIDTSGLDRRWFRQASRMARNLIEDVATSLKIIAGRDNSFSFNKWGIYQVYKLEMRIIFLKKTRQIWNNDKKCFI